MGQQAADIRKKKLLGSNNENNTSTRLLVATSLNDIGDAYASLKQYASTLKKYSESYRMLKKILGSHHPDVANAVYNMAKMHKERQHLEKAKNRFIQGGNIHLYNNCIEDALWNFSRALECALAIRRSCRMKLNNNSNSNNDLNQNKLYKSKSFNNLNDLKNIDNNKSNNNKDNYNKDNISPEFNTLITKFINKKSSSSRSITSTTTTNTKSKSTTTNNNSY